MKATSFMTVFLWARFWFFLPGYVEELAIYNRMMRTAMFRVVPFLVTSVLFLIGFAHGWALLALAHPNSHFLQKEATENCKDVGDELVCGSEPMVYTSWIWAFLSSFWLMYRLAFLGDVPFDIFVLSDYSGRDTAELQFNTVPIAWVFFLLVTMLFLVVLLNLLIAILDDAYTSVKNQKKNAQLEQQCMLLEDYDLVYGWLNRFRRNWTRCRARCRRKPLDEPLEPPEEVLPEYICLGFPMGQAPRGPGHVDLEHPHCDRRLKEQLAALLLQN